ncbi:MAG: hypothetical protein QM730_08735 [Anaerolineales bacterium]
MDVDGSESYHIVLHNLQTNSHIDLTSYSVYAQQPNFDFSPDRKMVAFLSDELGQFSLYLLTIETGERKSLLDIHHPMWNVKWSPDGKWIVIEAEMEASDRGIFVVEVESFGAAQDKSGKWKQLDGLNAEQPAWSPEFKIHCILC